MTTAISYSATLPEYSLGLLALLQWHHLDFLHVHIQDNSMAQVTERGLTMPSCYLTPLSQPLLLPLPVVQPPHEDLDYAR